MSDFRKRFVLPRFDQVKSYFRTGAGAMIDINTIAKKILMQSSIQYAPLRTVKLGIAETKH